jgi:hypothetical protein
MPAIVAMETSPDATYRDTASLIHKKLNDKHASIIHGQALDCVKVSFEYQVKAMGHGYPRGYRMNGDKVEALLESLWRTVGGKKGRKNEFVGGLVSVFDVDLKNCKAGSVKLPLMKYVAENLAAFEYRTENEVLYVVHCVMRVLSTTGENCLAKIREWNSGAVVEEGDLDLYARVSVGMGILSVLKGFLMEMYQISESKRLGYVGGGSKASDKAVSKKTGVGLVLDLTGMSFAGKEMSGEVDYWAQVKEYEVMMDSHVDIGEMYSEQVAIDRPETSVAEKRRIRSAPSSVKSKKRRSIVPRASPARGFEDEEEEVGTPGPRNVVEKRKSTGKTIKYADSSSDPIE